MSEKPAASIKTLARYEPDTVYIGTGEYVAECVRADDGDYYLAADVDAVIEALQAEIERLREQLRLATVDQAIAEAEANDARAEIDALMDRTTRLTPNDAGYVVAHANEDGAHVDTAITLTERLDLALEDRGHEMVLAERAKRHR